MKSFYEMCRILEWNHYDPDQGHEASFTKVLGEDEGAPFSIEVSYHGGDWEPYRGASLFARNDGSPGGWDEYKNPGKDFVNVPEPVRSRALAWVGSEIEGYVANYRPEDPRDNEEPRGREWDDEDQANYDRNIWLGGEKW